MSFSDWEALQCFALVVLFFHLSEVMCVLLIEPEEFSRHSFLISPPYVLAMGCGLAEHYLWRRTECTRQWLRVGVILVAIGESFRKAAWLTARASFTHLIQEQRRRGHKLVTHGVYAFTRHPGYLGWFIWAIGTQVMLGNPVCTVAFAALAWRFFSRRIPIEEWHLLRIFGARYRNYRNAVPTRIPGIP